MSYRVALPRDAGFDDWRPPARAALARDIPPDRIRFETSPSCGDLFAVSELPAGTPTDRPFHVSKRFQREASDAAIHRDPGRFDFLYRMLWRQRENRRLMEMALDPDVVRLGRLVTSVRRDLHKMTAFVRFRRIPSDTEERYVAWFEPDHFIVPRAAQFFRRRFTGMNWSILSPDKSAHWDGRELVLADGMTRSRLHEFEDEKEDLWRIYFASIFNPTRLKIKAMQSEMPKKYWKNLPEAGLIPELVRSAEAMTQQMLQTAPSAPARRHLRLAERTPAKADGRPGRDAERETLETLRAQAIKWRSPIAGTNDT